MDDSQAPETERSRAAADETPTATIDEAPETAERRLPAGAMIDKYRIVDQLGEGAMGVVYRAHDAQLARDVALKVHARGGASAQAQARMLREAQALAQLSHPNVVAAYDVGTHDGALFIAMELIDGVSLRAWLTKPRPLATIVRVLVAAGRGLAAAHAAGVVHRDVKPENVMVSQDGRARVVDFGLARGEHGGDDEHEDTVPRGSPSVLTSELTRTGTMMGTVGYMAPEQLAAITADTRSDQFAYAATAFRALTGQKPFPAEDVQGYREALTRAERSAWTSAVPRRIRRVIDRGLAVRPEARYPSLAMMVDDLERAASPPWRAIVAGLVAAGVLAGGGAAAAIAPGAAAEGAGAAPCQVIDRFDAAWGADERAAVQRAFTATGASYAAATFERVANRLDDYGARWDGMRLEACEAAHVRGAESELLLSLRNRCLDHLRGQASALVGLLAKADTKLLDGAIPAVLKLGGIEDCADAAALLGEAQRLPARPDLRRQIDEIDHALVALRAQYNAGAWEAGLAAVAPLVGHAEATGYAPVRARARLLQTEFQFALAQRDQAVAGVTTALADASENGDAKLVATAAARLFHYLVLLQRTREAGAMMPLIESALKQAADPRELLVTMLVDEGAVYAATSEQHAKALELLDRAAREAEKLGPEHEARRIDLDVTRGYTLLDKADYEGAEAQAQVTRAAAARAFASVVARMTRLYGPVHPFLFNAHQRLSGALAESKDRAGALAALDEARKIAPLMPPRLAVMMPMAEGWIWQETGEPARAIPYYERAVAEVTAVLGPAAPEAIKALVRVSKCMLRVGRYRDALPYLERWIERRDAEGARPGWRGEARFDHARALWEVGDKPRALRQAKAALALLREEENSANEVAAVTRWLAEHQ